jgi:hypothetical protein
MKFSISRPIEANTNLNASLVIGAGSTLGVVQRNLLVHFDFDSRPEIFFTPVRIGGFSNGIYQIMVNSFKILQAFPVHMFLLPLLYGGGFAQ